MLRRLHRPNQDGPAIDEDTIPWSIATRGGIGACAVTHQHQSVANWLDSAPGPVCDGHVTITADGNWHCDHDCTTDAAGWPTTRHTLLRIQTCWGEHPRLACFCQACCDRGERALIERERQRRHPRDRRLHTRAEATAIVGWQRTLRGRQLVTALDAIANGTRTCDGLMTVYADGTWHCTQRDCINHHQRTHCPKRVDFCVHPYPSDLCHCRWHRHPGR